jgi:hypothetical protein
MDQGRNYSRGTQAVDQLLIVLGFIAGIMLKFKLEDY